MLIKFRTMYLVASEKDGFDMKKAYIIPTGEEIKAGIVLDTDSLMIAAKLIKAFPLINVERVSPISDKESEIADAIVKCSEDADLVILIGGSGEGHKYSKILGKDYTHVSMESVLDESVYTALYGKNGHMWSKLVAGRLNGALVVNVPGPYIEAEAATEALLKSLDKDLHEINNLMAEAVKDQYRAF